MKKKNRQVNYELIDIEIDGSGAVRFPQVIYGLVDGRGLPSPGLPEICPKISRVSNLIRLLGFALGALFRFLSIMLLVISLTQAFAKYGFGLTPTCTISWFAPDLPRDHPPSACQLSIPKISNASSDQLSALFIADFDRENSEKKYPISPFALAGAVGFAIQAIAMIIIALKRARRK